MGWVKALAFFLMLVDTAHDQMDPQDLEDVMRRFVLGGFHVPVSTTIIDRADMYSVSQLYLVGAGLAGSDRVAYAYLFYPAGTGVHGLYPRRTAILIRPRRRWRCTRRSPPSRPGRIWRPWRGISRTVCSGIRFLYLIGLPVIINWLFPK